MIIDGGVMIEEPWAELQKIESHIGIDDPFFVKERFAKRADGYYCIRKTLPKHQSDLPPDESDLICMPNSKGRSSKIKNSLTKGNEKYLYRFYRQSNLNLVPRFHRKLSWFSQFNNVKHFIGKKILDKMNITVDRREMYQIMKDFDMPEWGNITLPVTNSTETVTESAMTVLDTGVATFAPYNTESFTSAVHAI